MTLLWSLLLLLLFLSPVIHRLFIFSAKPSRASANFLPPYSFQIQLNLQRFNKLFKGQGHIANFMGSSYSFSFFPSIPDSFILSFFLCMLHYFFPFFCMSALTALLSFLISLQLSKWSVSSRYMLFLVQDRSRAWSCTLWERDLTNFSKGKGVNFSKTNLVSLLSGFSYSDQS